MQASDDRWRELSSSPGASMSFDNTEANCLPRSLVSRLVESLLCCASEPVFSSSADVNTLRSRLRTPTSSSLMSRLSAVSSELPVSGGVSLFFGGVEILTVAGKAKLRIVANNADDHLPSVFSYSTPTTRRQFFIPVASLLEHTPYPTLTAYT